MHLAAVPVHVFEVLEDLVAYICITCAVDFVACCMYYKVISAAPGGGNFVWVGSNLLQQMPGPECFAAFGAPEWVTTWSCMVIHRRTF